MVTIILLLILLLVALVFLPFTRQIMKDKVELAETPVNKKFEVLVSIINDALLDGKGELTLFDYDPKLMMLSSEQQKNILVKFYYSTGNLNITLFYKYLQKELEFSKLFSGLRNISVFMQKDIANEFIELCQAKIIEHQQMTGYDDVNQMSGIRSSVHSEGDPTAVLTEVYDDLSDSQRKSIVNLMYMIGSSSGLEQDKIRHSAAFSQQVLMVNVPWEACYQQYIKYGNERIFDDLEQVSESIMDMVVLQCLHFIGEMSNQCADSYALEKNFLSSLGRLGYSEEKIQALVQKTEALYKMFYEQ
jgi:hypothetical protein